LLIFSFARGFCTLTGPEFVIITEFSYFCCDMVAFGELTCPSASKIHSIRGSMGTVKRQQLHLKRVF
jgi:hypothetical protein